MDYWTFESTGDWAEDNRAGREYADNLIQQMQETDAPIMVGHAVRALVERGEFDGRAVGFFHRLSERAMRTQ